MPETTLNLRFWEDLQAEPDIDVDSVALLQTQNPPQKSAALVSSSADDEPNINEANPSGEGTTNLVAQEQLTSQRHQDEAAVHSAIREEVSRIRASIPDFLDLVRADDVEKMKAMLQECSRFLPYFAVISAGDVRGIAMCSYLEETRFTEALYPPLVFYEHLRLWSDLSPGELSSVHRRDWKRHVPNIVELTSAANMGYERYFDRTYAPPSVEACMVRFPILEAARCGASNALRFLFEYCKGLDIKLCSPHDMHTIFHLAVAGGSIQAIDIVLPYFNDFNFKPAFILASDWHPHALAFETTQEPWNGPTPLELAFGNRPVLMHLLFKCQVHVDTMRSYFPRFLETMKGANVEEMNLLFNPENGLYHALTMDAIKGLVSLHDETVADYLLPFIRAEDLIQELVTTPDVRLVAFFLRFGSRRFPDAKIDPRLEVGDDWDPVIVHHIHLGHLNVVQYLMGLTIPHTAKELERWELYARRKNHTDIENFFIKWKE